MSDGALTLPHPVAPRPLSRLLGDAQLVKRASRGSEAAFTVIYERYHQDLYRYCRSILQSEDDARDALQNTMLKAMRGLAGEQRQLALKPWLFRIAHNESISLIRRRPSDAPLEAAEELSSTPADAETRDRLRLLIADLERLTARQRSALVMRELNGLSFAEIGAALETSDVAAKQAVYEARVALHDFESGREMSCGEIREKLSAGDRRLLRGRAVRAHLKECGDCAGFESEAKERKTELAALAPPLPPVAATAILESLLGGGGGGAGLIAGGAGAGLGMATAIKIGVAGVLVAGGGAAVLSERGTGADHAPAAAVELSAPDAAAGALMRVAGAAEADADAGAAHSDVGAGRADRAGDRQARDGSAPATQGASASAEGAAAGGGSADSVSQTPSAGVPASDATASPSTDSGGGGSTTDAPGASELAPGHGTTPPGQGGVPPGLGAPPPGQGGTPPGLSAPPPGLGGTPPGQGGTPPGQGSTPPGQGQGQGQGPK